mmetsp:Transcript_28112/g.89889  ORF Transcript_28112/g.89889 Transcript_28112/m.89889 type:complete len:975 (-) Transcript_28112:373-3297(-)
MPYCIGITALLAILYVLSRTEAGIRDCYTMEDFDIGAYRDQQLAASPPHIIECAAAGEGGSQEKCHLPRPLRYSALGQKGITLWMTGLSGSGKSTIAAALEEKLVLEYGKSVYRLDGDNIRTGLNRDLGFSDADRAESVRRVGELSTLFNDAGVITLVGLVSPFRADRDAVRRRHEDMGLKFMEVLMDVPLDVVKKRDPKGLYAKVDKGEIKGFTGVDAPYEPPLDAELYLKNYEMTIEESVNVMLRLLQREGVLEGPEPPVKGLPSPDGGEIVDLHVPEHELPARRLEAESLPKALLTDIDLNWLQTVGEGWAAPLKGFMREGTLLQTLHFNSILVDPANTTGNANLNEKKTDFAHFTEVPPRDRVSMSVPIVLPATDYTKDLIEASGKKDIALVTKHGKTVAILRNVEIYANRKEEIVTRCFGVIDRGHPYIKHIYNGGDWLLGGEVELLGRIRYNDGLDQYRFTQKELMEKFASMGADVIYAFQTRNPTHAGHAYLMRNGREQLLAKGYKNPVLWLSPLGGWTKEDDVPLDVRVKQHVAIMKDKDDEDLAPSELSKRWTVMAIWPSPMIYAGPTEVQFHAKSRRNAGASYFVVGRDPAGMKGSELAEFSPDDDLYDGDHGRYVLQTSPGIGGLGLLSFQKVKYDRTTQSMRLPDPERPQDFISISGSTMRALARNGARWCEGYFDQAMVDARECVPPGFMVPAGWDIVCDYYQNIDSKTWVPYSLPVPDPHADSHTLPHAQYGTEDFTLYVKEGSKTASPWHDLQLYPSEHMRDVVNLVTEIPMYSTAKMEVQKSLASNPIKQDLNKDGSVRFYTYGTPFFNYGMLPKTWEDPGVVVDGAGGDNDPLDVMEIGEGPLPMGSVVSCKVLGAFTLIDEGETDSKIICIRTSDPLAARVSDVYDLDRHKPGTISRIRQWLKRYKTSDGKPENSLAREEPFTPQQAMDLIEETHARWEALVGNHEIGDADFWYSE